MKNLIRQVKIILVGILSILAIILLFAQNATPLSPSVFQVKRLQEKIFFELKQGPEDKLNYYVYLLNERLKELKAVAQSDDSSYILTTSLRYSTTAGLMTTLIKENGLTSQIPAVLILFQNHQQIIDGLVETYPKDFNGDWKFIQDDINYLKIYSQMLSQTK